VRPRVIVAAYLAVVAFLLGMVTEKVRFGARRDAVIARYERALADWRAQQVRAERAAAAGTQAHRERSGRPADPLAAPLAAPLERSVPPPPDR
jgi:hypothetical protein